MTHHERIQMAVLFGTAIVILLAVCQIEISWRNTTRAIRRQAARDLFRDIMERGTRPPELISVDDFALLTAKPHSEFGLPDRDGYSLGDPKLVSLDRGNARGI